MSEELFRAIFVPDRFRAPVSGRAWLQAKLDAEGALAVTETRAGLIPREAAEATVYRCEADRSDPEKMRENLYQTKGMLMAENVTTVVADRLGRLEAHELVWAAPRRAADDGKPFREELLAEPVLRKQLSTEEIDAPDPARYLGSAWAFGGRALELYRREAPS